MLVAHPCKLYERMRVWLRLADVMNYAHIDLLGKMCPDNIFSSPN